MKVFCVSLLALVLLNACSKNNNDTSPGTTGETDFSVYLTDDPAPYDKVNIDIQSVEVHFSDDAGDAWHTLKIVRPGIYNLLRFTNGKDTIVATDRIASKKITQMRFILGENNTVVIDGEAFPLQTPSAQQSGLKFDVDATLTAGIGYKLWTDFDASRSIVTTGSGKYILKPVIRVYTKAISGSIQGIVLPPGSASWVYVLQSNDTVASAIPDPVTGMFMVNGLTQGTYAISVDGINGFNDAFYDNVNVTTGKITDVGTIKLKK